MNETLDFQEFFGTPIYVVELPEWINFLNKITNPFIKDSKKNMKELIKKRNKLLKKKINDFAISYHSSSLVNIPEFNEFKIYVEKRSIEILDHMGYDLKNYLLNWNELWVQEFAKNGGGHHEGHIHYDSHISGFYFLKVSPNTSFPIFHDPRPAKIMSQLPLKDVSKLNMGNNQIFYKPKPGTLILFPSFLEHQFSVDFGIDTFRFIHFNIQAIRNNK